MLRNYYSFLQTCKLASLLLVAGVNSVVAQEIIFTDGLEESVAITSFTAAPDPILQGENATLSWTTQGAVSCTPSGGAGDWSLVNITLADGSSLVNIPDTGTFTFTLTCNGVVGAPAFANTVLTADPVPAVITSFSASPSTVTEGGTTTLSWTTSFATSCTASDGAGGWSTLGISLPDGSAQITIPTTGNYTFTLTCDGAVGTPAVATDVVAVAPLAAITSFTASPNPVVEGGTTTLSWVTENATSCTPSGGAGGWDTEVIGLPGGSAQITIPTAGTYLFTLTCDGALNSQVTADVSVTASLPAVITSFTAAPSTVTVGASTTISWVTENAISCTPTGGTGGWDTQTIGLPGGSVDITIPVEGTHTFTLTCDGAAGDTTLQTVVVTGGSTIPGCTVPSLTGVTWQWIDYFQVNFPGPVSFREYAQLPRDGYLAIEFNTGNFVDDGKMSTIETVFEDGVRLGSFSPCPGDFDVAPECKYVWGLSGGIRWATNGRVGACALQPNTTYFFNVTFTDGVDPNSTTCDATYCITFIQYTNP